MELRISSPCPMSWERMPGTDRLRYCSHCRLNVYNLAVMSRDEVASLVQNRQGRLCARLYRRSDGWATLRDCARGRKRRNVRRVVALVGLLLLGSLGWLLRVAGDRDRSVHPRWVREVIEWVDPQPGGGMVVGQLCPPPSPPKNPPAGAPQ